MERGNWERTRLQIYSGVQMNTKKRLEPKDIVTFPWDEQKDTSITNEDIERLKKRAEQLKNNTNG